MIIIIMRTEIIKYAILENNSVQSKHGLIDVAAETCIRQRFIRNSMHVTMQCACTLYKRHFIKVNILFEGLIKNG